MKDIEEEEIDESGTRGKGKKKGRFKKESKVIRMELLSRLCVCRKRVVKPRLSREKGRTRRRKLGGNWRNEFKEKGKRALEKS